MRVSAHRASEALCHILHCTKQKDPNESLSVDGIVSSLQDLLKSHSEQEEHMVEFIDRQASENFQSPHSLSDIQREPKPSDPPPSEVQTAEEEKPLSERGRRFGKK